MLVVVAVRLCIVSGRLKHRMQLEKDSDNAASVSFHNSSRATQNDVFTLELAEENQIQNHHYEKLDPTTYERNSYEDMEPDDGYIQAI